MELYSVSSLLEAQTLKRIIKGGHMKQFRWDRVSFWLSVLLWSVLIIQKYIRSQQVHIFAAVMLAAHLAGRCWSD